MASVFTQIMTGELPGHLVWKDDLCAVFLSINPIRPGHALVVPRAEVDHWIDLEPQTVAHLFRVAQQVGRGQQRAFNPTRIGVIVAGLEVAHAHVHVIPIRTEADLSFAQAQRRPAPESLAEAARQLRAALRALGEDHVSE